MTGLASERMVEALARANRYPKPSRSPQHTRPPASIALSRQAGSRGSDVARAVGQKLGWPVYDQELLQQIAREEKVRPRLLEMLDEHHMGWLEEMVTLLCVGPAGQEAKYLHALMRIFTSLAHVGHCVIVGRGAPFVLPAETTLRVRVIAPRDDRVAHISRARGISEADAAKWVDRTDKERKQFIAFHFRKDPEDAVNYDLILNTGRLNVTACGDQLAQAVATLEKGD